jgi:hypothetical protein
MMRWEAVREFVSTLPGTSIDQSVPNPAVRVRNRVIARLREDGESMMVKVELDERAALLREDPQTFYITPHHANFPGVLIRLSSVDPQQLRELLTEAWRFRASQRMIREFEGR